MGDGESHVDDSQIRSAGTGSRTDSNLDEGVLELHYVFDALANARRRYLLYTLLEDREWTLTELATKVAAWESEIDEGNVTEDDRDAMYVSLLHAHVPKLVDDIIPFSRSEETITEGPNAEQVLKVLKNAGASLDSRQEAHARGDYDDEDGQ